jgi:hypothetical protein
VLVRLIVLVAGGAGLIAVQDYLPKWLMVLLAFLLFYVADADSVDRGALPEPVRSALAMVWLGGASLVLFLGGVAGLSLGGDVATLLAAGIPLGLAGFALLAVWIVSRLLRD